MCVNRLWLRFPSNKKGKLDAQFIKFICYFYSLSPGFIETSETRKILPLMLKHPNLCSQKVKSSSSDDTASEKKLKEMSQDLTEQVYNKRFADKFNRY
jgi:hypothetical protein